MLIVISLFSHNIPPFNFDIFPLYFLIITSVKLSDLDGVVEIFWAKLLIVIPLHQPTTIHCG